MKLNSFEEKIIDWNNKFPVDRWWREKHNISFMSKKHKKSSFLDQLFEYHEDRLISKLSDIKNKYIPNSGEFLNVKEGGSEEDIIKSLNDEFNEEFGLENG